MDKDTYLGLAVVQRNEPEKGEKELPSSQVKELHISLEGERMQTCRQNTIATDG